MDMLGKTGIGAQELSQAKATLTQQYLLGNMSYSDQAATLAYYVGLGDVKQASDYLAAVQAVTADDVRAVMPKSYLARITLGE
jgi:predicted Zn-dependent peptidase